MPSENNSKPSQTCEGWVVPNLTVLSKHIEKCEGFEVQTGTISYYLWSRNDSINEENTVFTQLKMVTIEDQLKFKLLYWSP